MLRRSLPLFTFASLTFLSLSLGCSAEEDHAAASDESAYTAEAQRLCSRADYDRAMAIFAETVTHARERLAGRTCTDGNMIEDLANDLATANATCSYVAQVVKTSPSAAPIREALAGNLALAVLDGSVRVGSSSGQLAFEGLDAALARGVTVYGPATASYGNVSKIAFAANGVATISRSSRDASGRVVWTDTTARYSVASGATAITIVEGATTTTYELREKPHAGGAEWRHIPSFALVPSPGGSGDAFATLPFECET